MDLVYAGEMQRMDSLTIESYGIPGRVLMENAGRGATDVLIESHPDIYRKKVGVIAGRGNNGGDGFVIARCLAQKGIRPVVYLLAEKEKVQGDAAANLDLLAPIKVPVVELADRESFIEHKSSMGEIHLWIDAIFGTGLNADVKGFFKEIIEFINSMNKEVFAVDIPSGLNSDTGRPCGVCIRADTTATFAFAKPGHILFPGAGFTGRLEVVDIGIPDFIADKVQPAQHLLTKDYVRSIFRPRSPETHKGDSGHLLIVAGSPGKTGAAAMTAISAMRVGAGLVTLGIPESLNPVLETMVTEVMTFPLAETGEGMLHESSFDQIIKLLSGKRCLAIGPGIGTDDKTKELVSRLVCASKVPVVIDADALNCLADDVAVLKKVKVPLVLTPHPGEMARLAGTTVREVQKDRISSAREFAVTFGVNLVLKGASTIIAHQDGKIFINPTGNSGMASGGMGDVLTGIISGLVSQGYPPETAAGVGVFIHGATADGLAEETGPIGFLATDVMGAIPAGIAGIIR